MIKSVALMGTSIRYTPKTVTVVLKGKYVNWFLIMHKVTETWNFVPRSNWTKKDYVKAAIFQSHAHKMTNWKEQFYINAY